ncbi:hypothetical protein A0H81_03131 [Grifola frondosa]|uniref:Uncharacterized protein n=1 Tax=Grifola frondosa TaxID=5627 RepID=A0A1C7MJK2_GRIFR|nr:hypothetical protein A0H81_03131 [Grifola frondosa]
MLYPVCLEHEILDPVACRGRAVHRMESFKPDTPSTALQISSICDLSTSSLLSMSSRPVRMNNYPYRQSFLEMQREEEYISMLPPMTTEEDLAQENIMRNSTIDPEDYPIQWNDQYYPPRKQSKVVHVLSVLVRYSPENLEDQKDVESLKIPSRMYTLFFSASTPTVPSGHLIEHSHSDTCLSKIHRLRFSHCSVGIDPSKIPRLFESLLRGTGDIDNMLTATFGCHGGLKTTECLSG